jgi:hypothetical protein
VFSDACLQEVEGTRSHSFPWQKFTLLLQNFGESVLFQDVVITNASQLSALRARLYTSAYKYNQPVGQLIRGLALHGLANEGWPGADMDIHTTNETILSIVMLTPCLGRYTVKSWSMNQCDFLCLKRLFSESLTYLDIHVWPVSDGDDVFPVLNTFPRLDTLILTVIEEVGWTHSPAYPLQNMSVRRMTWSSPGADTPILAFLSQCKFGPGCELTLRLDEVEPENAALLNHLFSSNSLHLLEINMPAESLLELNPRFMEIPTINFVGCLPPVHLLEGAILPRTIIISYLEDLDEASFWELLSSPAITTACKRTVTFELRHSSVIEFDWTEATGLLVDFVERLTPLAAMLSRHNIHVIDKHGRDVAVSRNL